MTPMEQARRTSQLWLDLVSLWEPGLDETAGSVAIQNELRQAGSPVAIMSAAGLMQALFAVLSTQTGHSRDELLHELREEMDRVYADYGGTV